MVWRAGGIGEALFLFVYSSIWMECTWLESESLALLANLDDLKSQLTSTFLPVLGLISGLVLVLYLAINVVLFKTMFVMTVCFSLERDIEQT